jgi:hypothetical protein
LVTKAEGYFPCNARRSVLFRAFELLGIIRDTSATLLQCQIPVPALPTATMALLQQAARGEPVSDSELCDVLEAAQRLQSRLGFQALV